MRIMLIMEKLKFGIRLKFNMVRYNTYKRIITASAIRGTLTASMVELAHLKHRPLAL